MLTALKLIFHLQEVYVSLLLDRCLNTVPYVLQIILLLDCTCRICNFVKLTVQWFKLCGFHVPYFIAFLLLNFWSDLDQDSKITRNIMYIQRKKY